MFSTTLSLVSALWRGAAQTRAIALWSGIGGGAAALGGVIGGAMLEVFWWGSVFSSRCRWQWSSSSLPSGICLFTLVKRMSGRQTSVVLSVIAVACLILGIQTLPNDSSTSMAVLFGVARSHSCFYLASSALRPSLTSTLRACQLWSLPLPERSRSVHSWARAFLGQQFTQNVLT